MSAWIDAEQELPDDEVEVLLHTADGEVGAGFKDGKDWRWLCASRVKIPVLHWMHFPQPPEDEQ